MRVLFGFTIYILTCCGSPIQKEKKPSILVTISPYDTFAKKIVGKTVKVITLIPSGGNPHNFSPTSKQMEKTLKVSAWFSLYESSEQKMFPLFQTLLSSIQIVDLCQSIDLIQEKDGGDFDRHVWLNPKLAKQQIILMTNTLKKLFPKHSSLYEENLSKVSADLDRLDKEIAHILAPHKGKTILVSHPAFSYLCKEYSLQQLSVEQGEQDPLAKTLGSMLKTIKKEAISVAFAQAQHNNTGLLYIAHMLKLPVQTVDPYSANYEENLKTISQLIAENGRH
ncbi:MAG: zinc ABC transporter substrate-binding protein [Chlamydiota bacterium]